MIIRTVHIPQGHDIAKVVILSIPQRIVKTVCMGNFFRPVKTAWIAVTSMTAKNYINASM